MILNRLQERLHISEQRAQEYFAMFSGQQPVQRSQIEEGAAT